MFNWKQGLAGSIKSAKAHTQVLTKNWLMTYQYGRIPVIYVHACFLILLADDLREELQDLRDVYLPETLLAYITTLQFAGLHLSRDFLLECMEFSTLVADEDSDLLKLFMKNGRLQELVELLAFASKNLLLVTSQKGSTSRSKKLRSKGWTHELWTVRTGT